MRTYGVFMTTCLMAASLAHAGPQLVAYQGSVRGAAGGAVPDGLYGMQILIFDTDTGGANLWSETDLSVPVRGGLFSTILGDTTPFGDLFNTNPDLWIEGAIDLNNNTFEPDEI